MVCRCSGIGFVCADQAERGGEGLFCQLCGCTHCLFCNLLRSNASRNDTGSKAGASIYGKAFHEYLSGAHILLFNSLQRFCVWIRSCGDNLCGSGDSQPNVCSHSGCSQGSCSQRCERVSQDVGRKEKENVNHHKKDLDELPVLCYIYLARLIRGLFFMLNFIKKA